MNNSHRKTLDQENPSHVIDLGDLVEIRLYDTSKKGIHGWQKLVVVFEYPNEPFTYQTGGSGYSKTDHALEQAFAHLGKMPKGYSQGMPRKYHLGGNYYKVSTSNVRKYK